MDALTFHAALRYANHQNPKPDAWFVMTEPPLIVNTVLRLRHKLGGRIIHHVDDLYPDLAVALGSLPQGGPVVKVLNRWAKAGLRKCDQVLALGECMARVLKSKGVADDRLAITPPWADGRRLYPLEQADNRFRREIGLDRGQVAVMYSGNMGLGHRFETILAAAGALARNDRIHFVFIGDGAKRPQIDAFRQAHDLKKVILLPYQPRERLRETLAAGDIHLISLDAKVQGLIVPSKLAGILAVGRPVVFLGDTANSLAGAILGEACGHVVPEGEVGTLVNLIQGLAQGPEQRRRLGESGRRLFMRKYDRAAVVPHIIAKIEQHPGL